MNWLKDKWQRFKKWITALIIVPTALAAVGVPVIDNQIDPYIDKGTHFELPIQADFPQGERVEIAKDKAEMTLYGWNDEYAIKITPQIPIHPLVAEAMIEGARDFDVPANRPLMSKRMEYKSGNVTAFIEPVANTTNEFDIDFILDSKPKHK